MTALKHRILTENILGKILVVLFVLNIPNLANAEVKWAKFSYFSNWGGLNDQQSTTEIADNEATDIQNIVFDTGGALKKREGYQTLPYESPRKVATGTTVCVNGLWFYEKASGSKYLVALCNNDGKATLMKKTWTSGVGMAGGVWDNIDNGTLSAVYTNNLQPDFAVAEDVLVFTAGDVSPPYAYNGTGRAYILTSSANVPSGSMVEYHKNQLFVSGSSTYPSRIYFSALDDITTWTATDFFDVQTSDGSNVRALLSAYNALYIFKDQSIWRLSGYERDSFVLEKMVDGVGTLSNASPVVTAKGIFFTSSQNDVCVYDGNYTVKFISNKIANTIKNLNMTRAPYVKGLGFSTYRFQDNDYYTSVTTADGATNNRLLVFDTFYNAWTKFKGINANALCLGKDDEGKNIMFFGDFDGYVHQYPSGLYYDGNVATSAIVAFYQTKWFRYPEVSLGDKYWRLLKVYALSQDAVQLHAECKSDYEASGKVLDINLTGSSDQWDVNKWDIALWGGDSVIVGRKEVEKGKTMFQVRFYNNDVDQRFTLLGFENFIEPVDRI